MKIGQFIVAAILTLAALPARAETIEISDDTGGSLADYTARWAAHRRDGVRVRIAGPCNSECTMLLGQIPRDRICVTPEASLGFRRADLSATTAALWKSYPTDIKLWITEHGGLTQDVSWMRAPDVYRYFNKCTDAHSSFSVVK
jgi:hypothetical protein